MFERNVVDRTTESGLKTIAVRLTFSDGRTVSGLCHTVATRTLADEVNQSGPFLDFEPYEGERSFIAKSSIARIALIELPKTDQLASAKRVTDRSDPYTILGVRRGADRADIQSAYHRLAKLYHPDRFAGLEIPKEIQKYTSAMARRINAAHVILQESEKQEAERRAQEAAEAAAAAAPKSAYEEFRLKAAARYA